MKLVYHGAARNWRDFNELGHQSGEIAELRNASHSTLKKSRFPATD